MVQPRPTRGFSVPATNNLGEREGDDEILLSTRSKGFTPRLDLQDSSPVDRLASGSDLVGNPARLALELALLDIHLSPGRVGEDEPRQAGPDDQSDDEEPPLELVVHRARVREAGP